jgi:hypothetical protein
MLIIRKNLFSSNIILVIVLFFCFTLNNPGELQDYNALWVTILLYGIVKTAKWTSSDFGIKKGFMKDILPYSLFTISAILFFFWLSKIYPTATIS